MTRAIFNPPKLRREECEDGERTATWLELFFDLIFVVAIAQLAHNFSRDFSFMGLAKLAVLFVPVWWCWIGATFYDTRFDNDGLVDRLITLMQMAIAASMAANLHHALDSSSIPFALSYIAFRAVLSRISVPAWLSLVAVLAPSIFCKLLSPDRNPKFLPEPFPR